MTFIVEEYTQELRERLQKLMEGVCGKGKDALETEYERGRIAELKQQLSRLKMYENNNLGN